PVIAGGGEPFAIRREAHAPDRVRVAFEREHQASGPAIPHLHLPNRGMSCLTEAAAGTDKPCAVRAEAHTADRSALPGQTQSFLTRRGVPHLYRPVAVGAGQAAAVRAEAHAAAPARVPFKAEGFLPGGGVPHLDLSIKSGGGQTFAIRAEADTGDA